ncbi:pentapeptide repeat-containing protein [Amorphus orientalis]|uniref:Pentapeptide repeat-containing protein n=1 Tax=Amorphus orientalis TaxID=649198 RepID=A0AAE4ARN8_9HYPH|nr:pentapeptide repeat-containing protein [Amorphus orientalis]MDQ0314397.1 hypothetical protein [Amorphus orientalis]
MLWLTLEWVAGIVGLMFISYGLLPSDPGGAGIIKIVKELIGVDAFRVLFVSCGLLLIGGSVYRNFYSHSALKAELRTALDDLNSDNVHVRLYAIEEILSISRKSRRLHPRAMQALASYVRSRFPVQQISGRVVSVSRRRFGRPQADTRHEREPDKHKFAQELHNRPRSEAAIDAKEAVCAIAKRRRFFDDPRVWIDLSETFLPSISLKGFKIGQVSFAGAFLSYARFDKSDLRSAGFDGATLNDASFESADLRNASFFGCLAHRIYLDGADLRDASFFGADLYDACIQKADARRASFFAANLWRLDGGTTNFAGADFDSSNLEGANLLHAKGLKKAQIFREHGFGAKVDKNTRLPWSTDKELRASGLIH